MTLSRKALIAIVILGATAALVETERASHRRVRFVDPASMGAPVAPVIRTRETSTRKPAGTATPPPASPFFAVTAPLPSPAPGAAPSAPLDTTNAEGDLRSSQERLNAIDAIAQNADRLFSTPELPRDFGSWTTNPQGLDQLDYQTPDGNITAWFGQGEDGSGLVRAQEAQLANGEIVDRWFSDNGTVEQVMHQYDRGNSYSVYYYATGEVEATRVVRDGDEIFTKYDRDGRQIQRTLTPASSP